MTTDDSEPATAEQLAAFDFSPLAEDDAVAMFRDFSAEPWAAECGEHGVSLRIALMLLTQTKEEVVEATEAIERAYTGSGEGPTADLLDHIQATRERFIQLAAILETAQARQLCAAAVIELRAEGGAA